MDDISSGAEVRDFLAQKTLAVLGVSRTGTKYGNRAFRHLKALGYKVYIVHPQADSLEGETCHKSLAGLPEKVGGLVLVVPPEQSEKVVGEAAALGIGRVWLQPGAESEAVLKLARDKGVAAVHGVCILMYAQPSGFIHQLHRWFKEKLGGVLS